tara:strand:- start:85518 stop:86330 length:813 start_codon:yes stop_codon:yes gene_type:complete
MFLAIDIGNTHSVFAFFEGDALKALWRLHTDAKRTADEYSAYLMPLAVKDGINFSAVCDVWVSSVVPDVDVEMNNLSQNLFDCSVVKITHDVLPRLDVKLPRPEEVGADRLVNAVAVLEYYKAPAIVIDFGTATTFDVVDASGAFVGGVIAPGVNLSVNALYAAAAKLPKISIEKPSKAIGDNTVSAMKSGIYWGYVSMVEGMVKRITAELDCGVDKPMIIATGGLSNLMAEGLEGLVDVVDEDLTLKGLKTIYNLHLDNVRNEQHRVMN